MATYITLADHWRGNDVLHVPEGAKTERLKLRPGKTLKFIPSEFDNYIYSYGQKYRIPIHGAPNIDDLVSNLDDVGVPAAADDPWRWTNSYRDYKREYGAMLLFLAKSLL